MTRWELDNSCLVFQHTANMEEGKAFKRSFPPCFLQLAERQEIVGFLLHSILGPVGQGRRQQWGSVPVFVLLGNQASTLPSGKTLGGSQPAEALRLPVLSPASQVPGLGLRRSQRRKDGIRGVLSAKETGQDWVESSREPPEPHQGLQANIWHHPSRPDSPVQSSWKQTVFSLLKGETQAILFCSEEENPPEPQCFKGGKVCRL